MEETVDLNKHDTLRHKIVIYDWTQKTIQQRRIPRFALFNSDRDQIQRTSICSSGHKICWKEQLKACTWQVGRVSWVLTMEANGATRTSGTAAPSSCSHFFFSRSMSSVSNPTAPCGPGWNFRNWAVNRVDVFGWTHTHTSHPKNETTMQSPRRFCCFGILLKYHHGNWKPTINGGFCIAGRIIYEWDIFQPPIFDCCRVEGLFIASTI